MAEIKSLAEIRLEVDLLMVDIELLADEEKNEAFKYIEDSISDLKIKSKTDTISKHPDEDNQDKDEYAPESKRIKLEEESHPTLKQEGGDAVNHDTSSEIAEPLNDMSIDGSNTYENGMNDNSEPIEKLMTSNHSSLSSEGMYENYEDQDREGKSEYVQSNLVGSRPIVSQLGNQFLSGSTQQSFALQDREKTTSNQILYNGKVPVCKECNISFPTLGSLDTHIKGGHSQNINAANKYNPSTTETSSLSESIHDTQEPVMNEFGKYKCFYCDKTCSKKYDLKNHMNMHTGRYRCNFCNVNLARRQSLESHNKTVEHLRNVDRSQSAQQSPATSHNGSTSMNFTSLNEGEQIYNEKNKLDSGGNIPRQSLPAFNQSSASDSMSVNSYTNRNGFHPHRSVQPEHKPPNSYSSVTMGQQTFNTQKEHSGTHSSSPFGQQSYQPRENGQLSHSDLTFKSGLNAANENRNINSYNQFRSAQDELGFYTRRSYNSHSPTNYQINNSNSTSIRDASNLFKCNLCSNTYMKRDSLNRHMISHSDRFKCQTCGLGFTEQGRLNSHLGNPDNCNRLIQRRTLNLPINDGTPSYPLEDYESDVPYDFPPGTQVSKKSQPTPNYNFSNFQNPSLAQKFLSNPNLSVHVKNEARNLY